MSKSILNEGTVILGLLSVAFAFLKLMNFIDWSWWYVTLPFWGIIALRFLVTYILYLLYHSLTDKKKEEFQKKQYPPTRQSRFN